MKQKNVCLMINNLADDKEKIKKILQDTQKFMHMLYERIYEFEDEECQKVLSDIKNKLDKDITTCL